MILKILKNILKFLNEMEIKLIIQINSHSQFVEGVN